MKILYLFNILAKSGIDFIKERIELDFFSKRISSSKALVFYKIADYLSENLTGHENMSKLFPPKTRSTPLYRNKKSFI